LNSTEDTFRFWAVLYKTLILVLPTSDDRMKILLTRKQQLQQQQNQQISISSSTEQLLSSPSFLDLTENTNESLKDSHNFKEDGTAQQEIEILETVTSEGVVSELSSTLNLEHSASISILDATKEVEPQVVSGSPLKCTKDYSGTQHPNQLKRPADDSVGIDPELREKKRLHEYSSNKKDESMVQYYKSWAMDEDEKVNELQHSHVDSTCTEPEPQYAAPEDDPVTAEDPAQDDEKQVETFAPSATSSHILLSLPLEMNQQETIIGKETVVGQKSKPLNPIHKHLDISHPLSDSSVKRFLLELRKRGLDMVAQDGDGNCLFRAVSLQVYGDADQHFEIRRKCIDYMVRICYIGNIMTFGL